MTDDEAEVAYAHGHTAGEMKMRDKNAALNDEIERLRAGFLRCVQADNHCSLTGKPCREPARCGCHLEMEGWLDDR